MAQPRFFLLSRVLLQFNKKRSQYLNDLSSITFTPDGSLWLGSDEGISFERLSPLETNVYGDHQTFPLSDYIDLFNTKDEIDIEGMDSANHYLWISGSHSTKRNKPKGKKQEKDLERIAQVKTDLNRYILARVPVIHGELFRSCVNPEISDEQLTASCLQKTEEGNMLIDALRDDPHLGPYLSFPIPSKENGFDIEGIAAYRNRVFLGFRGPVLRGWAIILEIEVMEEEPGVLTLKEIGKEGHLYKKHFVHLDGLGVRELILMGEDLIILGGPTMDLEGKMRVFRLRDALDLDENSIHSQESKNLEVLFDLPYVIDSDKAEGMALYPCLGHQDSVLIVYDDPDPSRRPYKHSVYGDVFLLEP